jgi:hypothetical protein
LPYRQVDSHSGPERFPLTDNSIRCVAESEEVTIGSLSVFIKTVFARLALALPVSAIIYDEE